MVDTEKEELILKLKSEVEIYKAKARDYKTKLKFELEAFKRNALQQEKNSCFKDLARMEVELNEAKRQLETRNKKLEEFNEQAEAYREKISKMEEEFQEIISTKETELAEAKDKIQRIQSDFKKKLTSEKQKHEQEQMQIQLENREESMKKVKLEFIMSNQRKMAMQQKYLEQQLDKDLKQLQTAMHKTEMDLKRDQLIPSSSAVSHLQELHQMMSGSLQYTKRLVSFMVFDQEDGNQEALSSMEEDGMSLNNLREGDENSNVEVSRQNLRASTASHAGKKSTSTPTNSAYSKPMHGMSSAGFSRIAAQIPLDRLVKQQPYEMIEVLLGMTMDNFKISRTPITGQMQQTLDLIQEKTDQRRVEEIRRQFLSDSKIHYQQFIHKLGDKISNLQTERAMLQNEMRELRNELNEQMDRNNQLLVTSSYLQNKTPIGQVESPVDVPPEGDYTENKAGTDKNTSKLGEKYSTNGVESTNPNDPDYKPNLDLALSNQNLVFLQRENQALRERTKEIRLILNNKVDELQNSLKLTKQSHEHDLANLKAMCKRDLDSLRQQELKTQEMLKKQIKNEAQVEMTQLKEQQVAKLEEIEEEHQNKLEDLQTKLEKETAKRESLYIELQRRKGETNNLYDGGFGTFTLAFENPYYVQLLEKQAQLQNHRQVTDALRVSLKGKKKKQRIALAKQEEIETALIKEVEGLANLLENMMVQSQETLNHFIEVGFQISRHNFQKLQIYNEQTFDSMARKYAYEFQIPLDQISIVQLETKLRQQISQNFALFNEICPIYISLNMGRPVNDQDNASQHPIENFRIIDRKSSMVTDQYLTINFLKSDLPFQFIRIVAFNNATCETFQLDLTRDDLMILVDGHMSLLQEENTADLCSLLMNQLTMIDRRIQLDQAEMEKERAEKKVIKYFKKVLVVEHRCFFNELFHQKWDSRNKLIVARHDKRKQGLLNDCETTTDFDKSIIYEAFFDVYVGDAILPLQEEGQADHFEVIIQQGSASGHLKLIAKLKYTDIEQSLCMFNSDQLTHGKSMNLAAALIRPPQDETFQKENKNGALAYVISIEKVINRTDAIIVRLASIQRRFTQDMGDFQWHADHMPNLTSTDYSCEVIYLIKKIGEPFAYTRVNEFEILNTESRAQLFSHAFGYKQKAFDFGIEFETQKQIGTVQSPASKSRVDMTGTRDNSYPEEPLSEHLEAAQSESRPATANQFAMVNPQPIEEFTGNEELIIRQFVVVRVCRVQGSEDENDLNTGGSTYEPSVNRHYAMVTLLQTKRDLDEGQLIVKVNLPELLLTLVQIVNVTQLIKLEELPEIIDHRKEDLCNLLFEKLVIETDQEEQSKIVFDEHIEGVSVELRDLQKKQFDEQIVQNNSDQIVLQVPDPSVFEIEKSNLQDCVKAGTMTIIGQRPFKVTAYFVNFLRNFNRKSDSMFDWQMIYFEAYLASQDINLSIALTESDLVQMMSMLKETTLNQDQGNLKVDTAKILHKDLSPNQFLHLLLDMITLSDVDEQMKLIVSFKHLQQRVKERNMLISDFQETGGRYLRRFGNLQDPEHANFTTSIPQTEISRKLIINIEKDFSDTKMDIKVYEITLLSRPNWRKIQVEIFQVEESSLIFRCDYFSTTKQNGRQLLIERFNLSDYDAQLRAQENDTIDQDESEKLRQKGMVLTLTETSFPHQFNFMLLEPCSHIFWHYTYSDNKLNYMERRADKQAFAQILANSIETGIFRGVDKSTVKPIQIGFQQSKNQSADQSDGKVSLLIPATSIEKDWVDPKQELKLIYGQILEVEDNSFRDVKIYFNQDLSKFLVTSDPSATAEPPKEKQDSRSNSRTGHNQSKAEQQQQPNESDYKPSEIELRFMFMNYRQGLRYFQGVLVPGKNPIVFQVEQACGFSSPKERAIRVEIKKILSEDSFEMLLDLIISEPTLFTKEVSKFGFNRGQDRPPPELKVEKNTEIMATYRESSASLPKMDDLALDLQTCEAQKVTEIPFLEPKKNQWEMIYRKMVELTDDKLRFIMTLLKRQKNQAVEGGSNENDHNCKLTLFEISSGRQDVFVFTEKDIMSVEQQQEVAKGRLDIKVAFKRAVDSRLRIKQLQTSSIGVEVAGYPKLMAFFVNTALLEQPKSKSASTGGRQLGRGRSSIMSNMMPDKVFNEPANQLFSDIDTFDIRKGICSNLMNPDPALNQEGTTAAQRSLLGQYERENLFFDVYQNLDPYEVNLRVNAFEKENFKMVSSAFMGGPELKAYLRADEKSSLAEGQKREELGRYLTQNILIDYNNNAMTLLKSQNKAEGETSQNV